MRVGSYANPEPNPFIRWVEDLKPEILRQQIRVYHSAIGQVELASS